MKRLEKLEVKSFITTLDEQAENKVMGGDRNPERTIASLPLKACQPVPTTDINRR